MGSTGSGRFSDYPGTGGSKETGGGVEKSGQDRCNRAFSVTLEDVEHSQYFVRTAAVPPVGTSLTIELRKRVVAIETTGASVGNLPTSFNYLADCVAGGFNYHGTVTSSNAGPTATVTADFAPV